MRAKILRALIAGDIWFMRNILRGQPGETISAAAWNAHLTGRFWGWTYLLIDLLIYPFERDHCRESWFSYKGMAQ
jgi:hypothetical protein